jgi:chromosome segregation ATPase
MRDNHHTPTSLIARAIVYAARQATLINQYGMTWEAIQTNTENILDGCSVPADGKMNSAEQVIAAIERYTGPLTEPVSVHSTETRVALELVDKYHQAKQDLGTANRIVQKQIDELASVKKELAKATNTETARVAQVDRLMGERDNARAELGEANARNTRQAETIRSIRHERDEANRQITALNESNTELGAELVKARAAAEKLREDNALLRGTQGAHYQNALAEKDLALRSRDTWRETARNTANERDAAQAALISVMAERETLKQQLDSMTRDREGYKRGAQFWMDSSNEQKAKVEKLRTFLQPFQMYDTVIDCSEVRKVLERT